MTDGNALKSDVGTADCPLCVFVASRGHSGSTMLELLLNRSRNIAAVGELDQLPLQIVRDGRNTKWEGRCSCDLRPTDCEVWRGVVERVRDKTGVDIGTTPFGLALSDIGLAQEHGWARPMDQLKYRIHRIVRRAWRAADYPFAGLMPYRQWVKNRDVVYRAVASERNVETIVDASKDAYQMNDLARFSELPVKILFLTRDVRGNVWSAIRRKSGSAESESRQWVASNTKIVRQLQKLPESQWMQVRYEDICADTDKQLEEIHDFLGVERIADNPEAERARRHTIAGNRIRFSPLGEIRQDIAWKDNLGQEQLDTVRRIAGPFAAKLGYRI